MADFGGFFDSVKAPASQIFRGLYGAPDDPRLGPGQNQNALAQGLTQGGLAMMLGGGSGPPGSVQRPNDFLSLLAQGMMASQQGTVMGQQNVLAAQHQMKMQELAQGPVSMDNLGRMMMSAIGAGDVQSARTISEVLKSMMAGTRTGASRPRFVRRTIDGKTYEIALDPFTLEEVGRVEVDPPVSALKLRGDIPQVGGEYVDDTSTGVINILDREGRVSPEILYENPSRPRSESEGRAEAFIPMLQASVPTVDNFDENPPVLSDVMFNNWLAGNFTPDMPRELFTAAIPIGEAWLRQTTGAAYNDTEFRNAGLLLIPRFGDSDKVKEMKRDARHLLIAMSKKRAGRTLSEAEQEMLDNVETRYLDHLRALQGARVAYDSIRGQGGDPNEARERALEAFQEAAGVGAAAAGGIRDYARNRAAQPDTTVPPPGGGGFF